MNSREWRSALAGLTAGTASLAVGELVAGFSRQLTSPVVSVANQVIDASPLAVTEWAISTFGRNDKKVLLIGILVLAALFALGTKTVGEEGEVDVLVASFFGVGFNSHHLIFEGVLRIIEKAANKGGLAVVDAACCRETQKVHVEVTVVGRWGEG